MLLGIDVGGMSIKYALCGENGQVLAEDHIPTRAREEDAETIISRLGHSLQNWLAGLGYSQRDVSAVGIGLPGTQSNRRGEFIFASNLPFKNTPFRQLLHTCIEAPIYLGNDANVAALAEARLGAGQGSRCSVTITIGTGIGSGVIINDRVYSGFNEAGVELGHMVIHKDGELCGCGQHGCLEAYTAAPALMRRTRQAAEAAPDSLLAREIAAAGGQVNGETPFLARAHGCPVARQLLASYVEDFAVGLANIVNCFFPECIILGGGIAGQGEPFRAEVEAAAREQCHVTRGLPETRILLARLGNQAGRIGAALFAGDCLRDGLPG